MLESHLEQWSLALQHLFFGLCYVAFPKISRLVATDRAAQCLDVALKHSVISFLQMLKCHLEQWALAWQLSCFGFDPTSCQKYPVLLPQPLLDNILSLNIVSGFTLTNVAFPSWTVVSGLAAFISWLCPDILPEIPQQSFFVIPLKLIFFKKIDFHLKLWVFHVKLHYLSTVCFVLLWNDWGQCWHCMTLSILIDWSDWSQMMKPKTWGMCKRKRWS